MVIIEKERLLPVLLDRLDTNNDMELRPLSGLLRNLARHSVDKQHMGKRPAGPGMAPPLDPTAPGSTPGFHTKGAPGNDPDQKSELVKVH